MQSESDAWHRASPFVYSEEHAASMHDLLKARPKKHGIAVSLHDHPQHPHQIP